MGMALETKDKRKKSLEKRERNNESDKFEETKKSKKRGKTKKIQREVNENSSDAFKIDSSSDGEAENLLIEGKTGKSKKIFILFSGLVVIAAFFFIFGNYKRSKENEKISLETDLKNVIM